MADEPVGRKAVCISCQFCAQRACPWGPKQHNIIGKPVNQWPPGPAPLDQQLNHSVLHMEVIIPDFCLSLYSHAQETFCLYICIFCQIKDSLRHETANFSVLLQSLLWYKQKRIQIWRIFIQYSRSFFFQQWTEVMKCMVFISQSKRTIREIDDNCHALRSNRWGTAQVLHQQLYMRNHSTQTTRKAHGYLLRKATHSNSPSLLQIHRCHNIDAHAHKTHSVGNGNAIISSGVTTEGT